MMANGKKGKKHGYEGGTGAVMRKRNGKRIKRGESGEGGGGRDWAGLPHGILDCIAGLLLTEDVTYYIRFRGVCASFRCATLDPVTIDPRYRPSNWILISKEHHLQRSKKSWRFCNLNTGKYIRARISELSTIGQGRTFLRVADGLLVFIDDASTALHLLNPFTRALVSLPPLRPLLVCPLLVCFNLRDFPSRFREYVYDVNFASSSSASITVVVSFEGILAWAKPGETEWSFTELCTTKLTEEHVCMPLIQSFQDRLYALCMGGQLSRFEPDQNRFTTLYLSLSDPTIFRPDELKWYLLVVSDGEMLVVCERFNEHIHFQVFKVDLENGNLIPKENLGGRALFICFGGKAFSVSTSTFSSIVPNSIHYTGYNRATTEYHLIGCACHPEHIGLFSDLLGPSSWIKLSPPRPNHLNMYCSTY